MEETIAKNLGAPNVASLLYKATPEGGAMGETLPPLPARSHPKRPLRLPPLIWALTR